jgi:hypothetical protein
MGYRSQVAGVISVDVERVEENGKVRFKYDQAKFKEMIGFIKLSRFWDLWNVEGENQNFGWRDGRFILYGADWKWYPEYADVQAWNELWENMQDIKGISGYFCRVGEETDDIETEEFGEDPCYDYFHVFSAIQFDGEDYLGKRETDAKEEQTEQAPTNQGTQPCGA